MIAVIRSIIAVGFSYSILVDQTTIIEWKIGMFIVYGGAYTIPLILNFFNVKPHNSTYFTAIFCLIVEAVTIVFTFMMPVLIIGTFKAILMFPLDLTIYFKLRNRK